MNLVTQSIIVIENVEYSIDYFVFPGIAYNGESLYAIRVEMSFCGKTFEESALICKNESQAVLTAKFLADNFVFPCHLKDVLCDMNIKIVPAAVNFKKDLVLQ